MSSHIVPSSFDPFATHPFTNNSGIPPAAPQPYPYPRPIPSTQMHTPQSSYPPTNTSASTSLPTAQTPVHSVHAPMPQRAPPSAKPTPARQHVFETFKIDRSRSPDLQDVLAKKGSPSKAGGIAKRTK